MTRSTRDLALAAYMLQQGMKVLRAESTTRADRVTEYSFQFSDHEDRWDQLAANFINSNEARYNEAVRGLKKLAKSAARGSP